MVDNSKKATTPSQTNPTTVTPVETPSSDNVQKTVLHQIDPAETAGIIPISKPTTDPLERFKSKRAPAIAGVETMLTALPHGKIADFKDWVCLHPDEEKYWSSELCFVNVPIIGQKRDTLHLIDEELAMEYLSTKQIKRCRLALGTMPFLLMRGSVGQSGQSL